MEGKKEILFEIKKSIFEDLREVFGEDKEIVGEISEKADILNKSLVFEVKRKSTEKVLKLYFVFFDGNFEKISERIERLKINIFKTARVALNLIYSKNLKTNWGGLSEFDLPPS